MNATALPSRPTAADMIEIRRNRRMVSSVKIAEGFDRRHDKVLEAIRTKLIGAFKRAGRRVLVDEAAFHRCVERTNG